MYDIHTLVQTCIYGYTNNEKVAHECERVHGRIYESVHWDEREGRNNIIIFLSKNKRIKEENCAYINFLELSSISIPIYHFAKEVMRKINNGSPRPQ